MSAGALAPSRLLARDVLAVGSIGVRTRRLRGALSAAGVAIGIASMVAVLGISASSQAELLDEIDALGTNLLTIQPGQSFLGGGEATLPVTSRARLGALAGVQGSASVYAVEGATVRRSAYVDPKATSGIRVLGADRSLPAALSARVAAGAYLTAATERFPVVVLGSVAARRLGSETSRAGRRSGSGTAPTPSRASSSPSRWTRASTGPR
jgi:putative ABC transport system permease protein